MLRLATLSAAVSAESFRGQTKKKFIDLSHLPLGPGPAIIGGNPATNGPPLTPILVYAMQQAGLPPQYLNFQAAYEWVGKTCIQVEVKYDEESNALPIATRGKQISCDKPKQDKTGIMGGYTIEGTEALKALPHVEDVVAKVLQGAKKQVIDLSHLPLGPGPVIIGGNPATYGPLAELSYVRKQAGLAPRYQNLKALYKLPGGTRCVVVLVKSDLQSDALPDVTAEPSSCEKPSESGLLGGYSGKPTKEQEEELEPLNPKFMSQVKDAIVKFTETEPQKKLGSDSDTYGSPLTPTLVYAMQQAGLAPGMAPEKFQAAYKWVGKTCIQVEVTVDTYVAANTTATSDFKPISCDEPEKTRILGGYTIEGTETLKALFKALPEVEDVVAKVVLHGAAA